MTLNDLENNVSPIVKDFVTDILSDIHEDLDAYGKDLSKDFANCLWNMYRNGDPAAEQNIRHLKVQIKQLAVIHQIRIVKASRELLEKALISILKIAMAVLV